MNERLLGVLGLLGLTSGCVSTGMARTLDEGKLQVSLAPGVITSELDEFGPLAEVGVRYGVTDRVDVGARLFLLGVSADTRVALLRSPSLDSGVDLTLAPAVSYFFANQLIAELPLLVGLNPGKGIQVVLGPRIGATLQFDGREDPDQDPVRPLVGGSLGIAVPMSKWVRVVPEVSLRTTLSKPEPLLQANVGFLFGGYAEP